MSRALKFVNVLSLEQFRLYYAKPSTANVWKVAYLSPILRASLSPGLSFHAFEVKVHQTSSTHCPSLPLDKLLVNLFVYLNKPLFGAVRPIAVGKNLFLQLRDAIFGGSHLLRKLLSHD